MNIAINCRHLLKGKLEGFGNYTFELSKRICENHPEHNFYLIFDRDFDPSFVFAENCKTIVLSPPTRHPFLNIFWARFPLHRALKKNKIDLFWSPDGLCNLRTDIPQVITIHDLHFEHYPEDSPKLVSWYYRYYYPKFAEKAQHILTVSEYSKQDLVQSYGITPKKISVVYNGVSSQFKKVSEEIQQQIKIEYSNGKPYFIFVGSIHPRKNVERLLKAFDIFYKRNNGFHLLIVGSNMWRNQTLSIPKGIKNAVSFTGHVQVKTLTQLMSSAFSLVYPPYFEGFGIPLVEAMKTGIPIVSSNQTCLPEIAGDAALYFDPFNELDMAEKMEKISTESSLREELIEKGKIKGDSYSWDQAAKKTWETLEKFLQK